MIPTKEDDTPPPPPFSPKGWTLAVKDYYPTPEMYNQGEKVPRCYAGPGVTIREQFAVSILGALASRDGGLVDTVEGGEHILVEKAVKLTDALIEYLANNEPEKEKEG